MPWPNWWLTLAFVAVGRTNVCCCGVGLHPTATRDDPYFSGGPLDGGLAVGVMEVCGAALPRY